ncbi:MAG: hypothetical protein AB1450_01475 [Pseudomonadota bacterium]
MLVFVSLLGCDRSLVTQPGTHIITTDANRGTEIDGVKIQFVTMSSEGAINSQEFYTSKGGKMELIERTVKVSGFYMGKVGYSSSWCAEKRGYRAVAANGQMNHHLKYNLLIVLEPSEEEWRCQVVEERREYGGVISTKFIRFLPIKVEKTEKTNKLVRNKQGGQYP